MRYIFLILLFPVFFLSCSEGGDVKITINVSNKKANEVSLLVQGKDYKFELDESGRALKTVPIAKDTYGYVISGRRRFHIYMQAGKDIDISFDENDRSKKVYLYCKDGGINKYLSKSKSIFRDISANGRKLTEEQYVNKLKRNIDKRRAFLTSKKLPTKFTEIEKERIAYAALKDVFYYHVYRRFYIKEKDYKTSHVLDNFIDSMFVQNQELLQLVAYKDFIIRYIEKKTSKNQGVFFTRESVLDQVDYIVENVNNQEIRDFLISSFVFPFFRQRGIEGNDVLVNRFNETVKGESYRDDFDAIIEKFEDLQAGKLAPNFKFKDNKGKEVALADLKGKYVYIYVWGSNYFRSSPNNRYYKALVNEYKDKNISFVDISLYLKPSQWKYYLKRNDLSGLHLYANNDKEFIENYQINILPRYILIDIEGKIIDATADSPSSVKIKETLAQLPGL